jgi:group II intron reverse transcriptase/maturase
MFTAAELEAGWERVRDNHGCAGVDAVSVERFGTSPHTRLKRLLASLANGEYRPLPLLEIVIEKAPGKLRRLLVPTVNDRIVQTAMARRLSHSFEDEFLDVSYAYRPGPGVDQAIARVLQLRDRGYHFVLDADITAYFDQVDHELLKALLRNEAPEVRGLIEDWLRMPIWDGFVLKKLEKGVPQGSPVSPVLANLFLHELDVLISAGDHHIVRYADDFLVLCDSAQGAEQAREITAGWLNARRLELHPEKTAIRTFNEGFRFLGVTFAEDQAMVP